jgi:UDP-N-acetylglucosamine 4,6-dehydratase
MNKKISSKKNNCFNNKTLLISGGTGTFGNIVLNDAFGKGFKKIIIFSRDEKKQDDMRKQFSGKDIDFLIGDVRSERSCREAMIGVDFVFHAAALKQVPSCEFFPNEAYLTNVVGTQNILNAACEQGVSNFTFLSTDKAVYPINSMGISKAMAEKICLAKARIFKKDHGTKIHITRYGNVMGSRGSVIPVFVEKILNNKPLPITSLDMTRFLMLPEESLELVTHSFNEGKGGEIFVRKSPSCSIMNLLFGLEIIFNKKLKYQHIGIRHGEKLYETLISSEEKIRTIESQDYYAISPDFRDLDYELYFTKGDKRIEKTLEYNSSNSILLNQNEVAKLLLKLDIIKSLKLNG